MRIFQTSEETLRQYAGHCTPQISKVGGGLDELISLQHSLARFDLSITRHPDQDFSTWQSRAGTLLKDALIVPHSLGVPCRAKVLSVLEREEYRVEEIEFTATPPLRVPATVVVPRNGKSCHPAVVALHCMGGFRAFGREKLLRFEGEPDCLTEYRKTYYEGRSLQEELARRGYLSIAIDAVNFGLRTFRAAKDRQTFVEERLRFSAEEAANFTMRVSVEDENRVQRALGIVGASLASLVATDDLRTVDYLATRNDVDAERIACVGLSMGAFRANYLSALDPRIRAAASVCWISTLAGIVDYNPLGAMGFFALPPGLYRRMDMTDIVALSAPKPFLAIGGWRDILMQPCGTAEAHLRLRNVWKSCSSSASLGSLVYDKPHEFSVEMQQATLDFLDSRLSVAPRGSQGESEEAGFESAARKC